MGEEDEINHILFGVICAAGFLRRICRWWELDPSVGNVSGISFSEEFSTEFPRYTGYRIWKLNITLRGVKKIDIKDFKVKFATGTLTKEALSWWNSFAQPIGIKEAYKITWSEFKNLLIKKYCPRTEVKKIEDEYYNLTVKGNDLKTYLRRFQELAVLCLTMVLNSKKLMEVFIGGLPRSIEGNVTASKP
ncbi:reverse transcriptase domain-containing protein [Tanacetum coccineum]